MTSRLTLALCFGALAFAALFAGLWATNEYLSATKKKNEPLSAAAAAVPERLSGDSPVMRAVYPGPEAVSPQTVSALPRVEAVATPPSVEEAPSPVASAAVALPPSAVEQQPVAAASAAAAGPRAPERAAAVNLNTASVQNLNLLGAGRIGRRIAAFRPYASPEELVSKRVLRRAHFERIKAAVTVR